MAKSNAMQKAVEISESRLGDKERHLNALGTFDAEVLHSQVVCMTYIQPSVTEGGVHLPDGALQEDRFQGKIALVVAMGAGAFKDDKIAQFHGAQLKVGDWVFVRASDGMEFFYNGNTLRIFEDVDIRMKINDPRAWW